MIPIPRAVNVLRSIPTQTQKLLKMRSPDKNLSKLITRYSSTASPTPKTRSPFLPVVLVGTLAAGSYYYYYYYFNQLPRYTRKQVAEHQGGVWMTYQGNVYDLTKFIQEGKHPGGGEMIEAAAGDDLEMHWEDYQFHKNPEILKLLEPMKIGTLKGKWGCKKTKEIPRVNEKDYRLELVADGVVLKKLTLEDLKRYPKHTIDKVMPCKNSGKQAQEGVKSTWTGVRLSDVLKDLGMKSEGYNCMEFESLDARKSKVMSIKNDMADVLLAYQMDGAELSVEHGYPVRVITQHRPWGRNMKWLGKIVLSKKDTESKEA